MLKIHETALKDLTKYEKAIYTKFAEVLAAALMRTVDLKEAKYKLDALLRIAEEEVRTKIQREKKLDEHIADARKKLMEAPHWKEQMSKMFPTIMQALTDYHEDKSKKGSSILALFLDNDYRDLSEAEVEEHGLKKGWIHKERTGVRIITFVVDTREREII